MNTIQDSFEKKKIVKNYLTYLQLRGLKKHCNHEREQHVLSKLIG